MFSVTSLGFLPFMALFVCLWYRVPQPSRWMFWLTIRKFITITGITY